MFLFRPLILSLAVALTLTACNKSDTAEASKANTTEAPKADSIQTTTEATQAPANNLDNSPTVAMMADVLKLGAWASIQASGSTANLTEEQLQCLFDHDKALFLEAGKAELTKNLGEDLIKQSDEFYKTEVGQKVLKFVEQTQLQAQGKPIEGEPVVLTEEDKVKMAEFGQSEAGQKIAQATSAGVDQEALKALMTELGEKEKTRCKLS